MKKIVSAIMLTLLLISMLALAVNIQPAKAKTITVPVDYPTIQGAINAANEGDTIFVRNGTYYENVVVNKNNLTLIGENRNTAIIDGNGTGTVVHVSHADYVEISGFTVRKGGVDGIFLEYSNHNKLTDLNVHSNGRNGILTQHSEYNLIAKVNTYSNGWHGITLGWYPNHSVITNCNASFNEHSGIHPSDWPTNVTITNCTASWNGEDGVWLGWTTDGLIRDCTVHDNGRYGIRLDTDRYCTVADCYVGSNAQGIRVYIHSSYYIHNTITNCDLESNDYGIIVCHRGGYGIWYLDTTIKNCDIRNNEHGILVEGNGSKIYHNNLIDNTIQARDNGVDNTWDDGYPVGGNYWSDYNGTDLYNGASQNQTGSDGIGDTPYVIKVDNQDNFPLMKPYPWDSHDIGITSVDVSKTVVGQGYNSHISVTIFNYGNNTENFNVTANANSTIIGTSENITLAGRSSITIIIQWNTAGFAMGNYTVSAYATPVPGETNTTDNSLVDGWILVTIPGDVDGDRDVDIFDIVAMAGAYGAKTGDSEYELNCDLDGDGDIDIFDIVGACVHYGENW